MPGVYMIRCRPTGRYYIGGTKMAFETRFDRHRSHMRCGKAPRLLQACYDLYGLEALDFVPLQEFPPELVAEKEREAIETLKPDLNIYGVRPAEHLAVEYDVEGKPMTVAQIAQATGLHEETIRARMARGMTGAALLAGKHKAPRKPYTRRR